MSQQTYIAFIEAFECLSPYELDRLCQIIHKHYQVLQESKIGTKEIREILIKAMQAAQIEAAEHKLKEAELNLQLVKSRTYNNQP